MQEKTTILSGSKTSIALSIVVALIFSKGFEFVIQAMSLPLETAAARLVNAVLAHGWPNSLQLNEPHYPLMMVAYTAVGGILLLALGLVAGNRLVSRADSRD